MSGSPASGKENGTQEKSLPSVRTDAQVFEPMIGNKVPVELMKSEHAASPCS